MSSDKCRREYTVCLFRNYNGASAILWDSFQRNIADGKISAEQQPSKAEEMKWALTVENIISQYHRRKALSIEIAEIWAQQGIKTYGLKGWALSTYYPKPELCKCGDFDCRLGEDFSRGNEIAITHGAQFNPHDYRHSHVYYKGLTTQNHRYSLPIRGNARNICLEQYMKAVIPCNKRVECQNGFYGNNVKATDLLGRSIVSNSKISISR